MEEEIMIVAGIDIGSTTGKAVLMIDDKIILGKIITVTTKPSITASMAIDEAIKNAGLSGIKDIEYLSLIHISEPTRPY